MGDPSDFSEIRRNLVPCDEKWTEVAVASKVQKWIDSEEKNQGNIWIPGRQRSGLIHIRRTGIISISRMVVNTVVAGWVDTDKLLTTS
jgi:hypothetical protein